MEKYTLLSDTPTKKGVGSSTVMTAILVDLVSVFMCDVKSFNTIPAQWAAGGTRGGKGVQLPTPSPSAQLSHPAPTKEQIFLHTGSPHSSRWWCSWVSLSAVVSVSSLFKLSQAHKKLLLLEHITCSRQCPHDIPYLLFGHNNLTTHAHYRILCLATHRCPRTEKHPYGPQFSRNLA